MKLGVLSFLDPGSYSKFLSPTRFTSLARLVYECGIFDIGAREVGRRPTVGFFFVRCKHGVSTVFEWVIFEDLEGSKRCCLVGVFSQPRTSTVREIVFVKSWPVHDLKVSKCRKVF